MQPIQDKDLDRLFKQRFEDFEVQPSAGSWKKITDTLDKPHKKSKPYPFWMAAASVIILAAAGLWLNEPTEVIKLRGKADNQIVAKVNGQPTENPEPKNEFIKEGTGKQKRLTVRKERTPRITEPVYAKQAQNQVISEKLTEVDPQENPVLIAKQDISVRKTETKFNSETKAAVYIAQTEANNAEVGDEQETSNSRIKSVGGLVNFVIAQVDKREDKIIEFKEGAEGSEVSGINLGLLKFKSRKR